VQSREPLCGLIGPGLAKAMAQTGSPFPNAMAKVGSEQDFDPDMDYEQDDPEGEGQGDKEEGQGDNPGEMEVYMEEDDSDGKDGSMQVDDEKSVQEDEDECMQEDEDESVQEDKYEDESYNSDYVGQDWGHQTLMEEAWGRY